jgi:hypothetical protein
MSTETSAAGSETERGPLHTAPPSRSAVRIGRVLSGIVILFMIFDAAMKLIPLAVVTDSMAALGYPPSAALARGLGVVILVCTALYVFPGTAILGAILMTGYLGGAIASHLRIGSPLFSHILFGLYLGLMVWGGLYLRDERVRALIPLRR